MAGVKILDLRNSQIDGSVAKILPRPELDIDAACDLVRPLMQNVLEGGAQALRQLSQKFDRVSPEHLRVPLPEITRALEEADPDVLDALRISIERTRLAHSAQLPQNRETEITPGGVVYQRWIPLQRVGLYVPGGLAVYPSSVVMNVVAAQVAGVEELVVASPPQQRFGGLPHPTILAACALLGVTEVIAVGGAQAIAAMSYGFTDGDYTCAPVDKVTGPGNIYVAAAKRIVQAVCGIDSEAGTTEIGILADRTANPRYVALDLISQAEHDPAAASVLITDSAALAQAVNEELETLVPQTANRERIEQALSGPQSGVVLTNTLEDATQVMEAYAPEHLEVMTADAHDRAMRMRNAGAVFVGDFSPVPLGDYLSGSNHVLPTGGTARYSSGLNSTQYLRSVQVVEYDQSALKDIQDPLVTLANAEGLPAHGESLTKRFENLVPKGTRTWPIAGETDFDAAKSSGLDNPADKIPAYTKSAGKVDPSAVGGANICEPATLARPPFRAELASEKPYGAPQLDVPAQLNVNENPYPPSAAVIESISRAVGLAARNLNRYADRDALGLRADLAKYLADEAQVTLPVEQIWAANGSNEIMLQLLTAFGGPKRVALGIAPTYSMYHEYARNSFTNWVCLPAEPPTSNSQIRPFSVQRLIQGMQRHRPAVLLLPRPNNPTGMALSIAEIDQILRAATTTGPLENGVASSTLVVIDEAYAEFRPASSPSALVLLSENPHLVVTRTMSKAFAAAGLRLGYMAAAKEVVDEIQKVRLPYHLSLLTQAAARAALAHSDELLAKVEEVRQQRDQLSAWLKNQGFEVAPSEANFLFFGSVGDDEKVWQGLLERGVLVRNLGPTGFLRVTVGTATENEMFKQALLEVL